MGRLVAVVAVAGVLLLISAMRPPPFAEPTPSLSPADLPSDDSTEEPVGAGGPICCDPGGGGEPTIVVTPGGLIPDLGPGTLQSWAAMTAASLAERSKSGELIAVLRAWADERRAQFAARADAEAAAEIGASDPRFASVQAARVAAALSDAALVPAAGVRVRPLRQFDLPWRQRPSGSRRLRPAWRCCCHGAPRRSPIHSMIF